jgi:3-hydroxyacyl-CoA dehydrogenase
MSDIVNYELRGPVAVLSMNKGPVNGLGAALRTAIADAVDRANADPAVQAIVLTGTPRVLGRCRHHRVRNAQRLARAQSACRDRPDRGRRQAVVAAIAGQCLGGGLELALGCHFRVALPDAQLGLPEVKIGLLPGGGGTQRMPRLIGLEPAVNMVTLGNPAPAKNFAGTPLIDRVADGDVVAAAVAFAQELIAAKTPPRRTRAERQPPARSPSCSSPATAWRSKPRDRSHR